MLPNTPSSDVGSAPPRAVPAGLRRHELLWNRNRTTASIYGERMWDSCSRLLPLASRKRKNFVLPIRSRGANPKTEATYEISSPAPLHSNAIPRMWSFVEVVSRLHLSKQTGLGISIGLLRLPSCSSESRLLGGASTIKYVQCIWVEFSPMAKWFTLNESKLTKIEDSTIQALL